MKIIFVRYPYVYNGVYHLGDIIALADFSNETSSDNSPDVKVLLNNVRFHEKTIDLQKKT